MQTHPHRMYFTGSKVLFPKQPSRLPPQNWTPMDINHSISRFQVTQRSDRPNDISTSPVGQSLGISTQLALEMTQKRQRDSDHFNNNHEQGINYFVQHALTGNHENDYYRQPDKYCEGANSESHYTDEDPKACDKTFFFLG